MRISFSLSLPLLLPMTLSLALSVSFRLSVAVSLAHKLPYASHLLSLFLYPTVYFSLSSPSLHEHAPLSITRSLHPISPLSPSIWDVKANISLPPNFEVEQVQFVEKSEMVLGWQAISQLGQVFSLESGSYPAYTWPDLVQKVTSGSVEVFLLTFSWLWILSISRRIMRRKSVLISRSWISSTTMWEIPCSPLFSFRSRVPGMCHVWSGSGICHSVVIA